jgi:isoleucyl-tRNA synthetase
MGADALRLYFLSSPIVHGEEVIFSEKFLKEITGTVMLPLYNSVKYFLNYKQQYNWSMYSKYTPENVMDRWIISVLNKSIKDITSSMDEYRLQKSTKSIFELIDVLSKWYIRRSRDRFVNGDIQALNTLHFVLISISKLIAPFAPFLAESIYQTLVGDGSESVHLEDYPLFEKELLDEKLIKDMQLVREICSMGLNIRDENHLKVRQPLSIAYVPISDKDMLEIVKGELNVKEVKYSKEVVKGDSIKTQNSNNIFVSLDINISEKLKEEGILNEILRGLQVIRKESGCQLGQTVSIEYMVESKELGELIERYSKDIKKGILIKELNRVNSLETRSKIIVGEEEILVNVIK